MVTVKNVSRYCLMSPGGGGQNRPPGENPGHKQTAAQRNKYSDITAKLLLARDTGHFLARGTGLIDDSEAQKRARGSSTSLTPGRGSYDQDPWVPPTRKQDSVHSVGLGGLEAGGLAHRKSDVVMVTRGDTPVCHGLCLK